MYMLLIRKMFGGFIQKAPTHRLSGRQGLRFEPRRPNPPVMTALLFLDQIKRDKGVWWMPWQQEAMKDVILCDKPWGAENEL